VTAIRRSPEGARLRRIAGPRDARVLVLLLHGGTEDGNDRAVPLWWPPALRMAQFAPALRRTDPGAAVFLLWNAVKGWADGTPPVRDARWALDELAGTYPGTPIVLLGHSMGGRAGVRVLGTPAVAGLVGLAAWLPADEPSPARPADGQRAPLVLIHGAGDGEVPITEARRWANSAGRGNTGEAPPVRFVTIPHGEHTMLRQASLWHRLAARGVGWVAAGSDN
jgi:alpha-beta hydrolase superfamily lysophospholipase